MRDLHDAGSSADPTPALRALSARFPGALRELDRLPRPALDALITELSARAIEPSRMIGFRTLHAFHVSLRGALAAKSWLSQTTASPDSAFRAAPLPLEALAWADELTSIRKPPHGKLTSAVVKRLARLEGASEAEIRARVDLRRHR